MCDRSCQILRRFDKGRDPRSDSENVREIEPFVSRCHGRVQRPEH